MADERVVETVETGGVVLQEMPVIQRENARDIRLGRALYEEAYNRGMNLTELLEEIDPSESYGADPLGRMDAFRRQLYLSGIRFRSDPRRGLWASQIKDFYGKEHGYREGTAALFPEFLSRVWRGVSVGPNVVPGFAESDDQKRFYLSSAPISDVMYPDYLQAVARQRQIAPAIPLSTIVALTTPIDAETYTAFYLTEDEDERRMRRVAEGAEVPTAVLTGSDHSIKVKKYGRRLLATYESVRRMRIDRLAMHLALLAVQAEVDKFTQGVDVLINGDGNAVTAATNYNLTTLDPAAIAGTPTLLGYLAWRMQWPSPYYCDVVLARYAHVLELMLCNAGSANVIFGQIAGMFGIGGVTAIGPQLGPAKVGWTNAVPAEYWLGIDSRFALEMVTEIGATMTETDKIIASQWNEIVMTECVGFCIFDNAGARTLNLNA